MKIILGIKNDVNKNNYYLNILFLFLFVFAIIASFLNLDELQYHTILLAYLTFYLKYFLNILSAKFTSIDLYFLFFVFYFFSGLIYFNSPVILNSTKIFFEKEFRELFFAFLTPEILMKVNLGYLLALTPIMLLINLNTTGLKFVRLKYFQSINQYQTFSVFISTISTVLIMIFFYQAIEIYIQFKGKYALFDPNESVRGLLGWNAVLISGLVSVSNLGYKWNQKKIYTLLVIIVSFLFFILHFRMFVIVTLFALIINLELRGFEFKRKHLIYGFFLFFIIAFDAVRRFENFDRSDAIAVYFNVLGEFFLSQFYYVSLVVNPFYFKLNFIQYFDFITQTLPSFLRPNSGLIDFIQFNNKYGYATYTGGISILAQARMYTGFLYPLFFIIVSYMLVYFRTIIRNKQFSIVIPAIPIVLMVLPRTEFWVARSGLINIAVLIILYFIFAFLISFKSLKSK